MSTPRKSGMTPRRCHRDDHSADAHDATPALIPLLSTSMILPIVECDHSTSHSSLSQFHLFSNYGEYKKAQDRYWKKSEANGVNPKSARVQWHSHTTQGHRNSTEAQADDVRLVPNRRSPAESSKYVADDADLEWLSSRTSPSLLPKWVAVFTEAVTLMERRYASLFMMGLLRPPEVTAQGMPSVASPPPSWCCICCEACEPDGKTIQCSRCKLKAHADCAFLEVRDREYTCDSCLLPAPPPCCTICRKGEVARSLMLPLHRPSDAKKKGAHRKRLRSGDASESFAHVVCAMLIPEYTVDAEERIVREDAPPDERRKEMRCAFCYSQENVHGSLPTSRFGGQATGQTKRCAAEESDGSDENDSGQCTQCAYGSCIFAMHPSCAAKCGLVVFTPQVDDGETVSYSKQIYCPAHYLRGTGGRIPPVLASPSDAFCCHIAQLHRMCEDSAVDAVLSTLQAHFPMLLQQLDVDVESQQRGSHRKHTSLDKGDTTGCVVAADSTPKLERPRGRLRLAARATRNTYTQDSDTSHCPVPDTLVAEIGEYWRDRRRRHHVESMQRAFTWNACYCNWAVRQSKVGKRDRFFAQSAIYHFVASRLETSKLRMHGGPSTGHHVDGDDLAMRYDCVKVFHDDFVEVTPFLSLIPELHQLLVGYVGCIPLRADNEHSSLASSGEVNQSDPPSWARSVLGVDCDASTREALEKCRAMMATMGAIVNTLQERVEKQHQLLLLDEAIWRTELASVKTT